MRCARRERVERVLAGPVYDAARFECHDTENLEAVIAEGKTKDVIVIVYS